MVATKAQSAFWLFFEVWTPMRKLKNEKIQWTVMTGHTPDLKWSPSSDDRQNWTGGNSWFCVKRVPACQCSNLFQKALQTLLRGQVTWAMYVPSLKLSGVREESVCFLTSTGFTNLWHKDINVLNTVKSCNCQEGQLLFFWFTNNFSVAFHHEK